MYKATVKIFDIREEKNDNTTYQRRNEPAKVEKVLESNFTIHAQTTEELEKKLSSIPGLI